MNPTQKKFALIASVVLAVTLIIVGSWIYASSGGTEVNKDATTIKSGNANGNKVVPGDSKDPVANIKGKTTAGKSSIDSKSSTPEKPNGGNNPKSNSAPVVSPTNPTNTPSPGPKPSTSPSNSTNNPAPTSTSNSNNNPAPSSTPTPTPASSTTSNNAPPPSSTDKAPDNLSGNNNASENDEESSVDTSSSDEEESESESSESSVDSESSSKLSEDSEEATRPVTNPVQVNVNPENDSSDSSSIESSDAEIEEENQVMSLCKGKQDDIKGEENHDEEIIEIDSPNLRKENSGNNSDSLVEYDIDFSAGLVDVFNSLNRTNSYYMVRLNSNGNGNLAMNDVLFIDPNALLLHHSISPEIITKFLTEFKRYYYPENSENSSISFYGNGRVKKIGSNHTLGPLLIENIIPTESTNAKNNPVTEVTGTKLSTFYNSPNGQTNAAEIDKLISAMYDQATLITSDNTKGDDEEMKESEIKDDLNNENKNVSTNTENEPTTNITEIHDNNNGTTLVKTNEQNENTFPGKMIVTADQNSDANSIETKDIMETKFNPKVLMLAIFPVLMALQALNNQS